MTGLSRTEFGQALRSAQAALDAIRPRLAELAAAREVVVYAYGARGSDLAHQLRDRGVSCLIYDNSPAAIARAHADGFETTNNLAHHAPLIVAAGQNQIEILDDLSRPAFGLAEAIYAFDLRNSYGQARDFTDAVHSDFDALFAVYDRLDARSKLAFLDLLQFRASLDVRRMAHRRPISAQFDPPVPGLRVKSYCDLGAYNGDSLAATKAVFPDLTRSFTIEPNPDQAAVLAVVAQRLGLRNTNFVGAAWDHAARLGTRRLANGMLVLDESLAGDIEAQTLDVLLGDEPFDYFKVDVEGSEAKALAGGVRALRWAKCLAVSAYHYPGDLIDLVACVDDLTAKDDPPWSLAFAHYSQSFEGSMFYFFRSATAPPRPGGKGRALAFTPGLV